MRSMALGLQIRFSGERQGTTSTVLDGCQSPRFFGHDSISGTLEVTGASSDQSFDLATLVLAGKTMKDSEKRAY
jgi:hypothetical protein